MSVLRAIASLFGKDIDSTPVLQGGNREGNIDGDAPRGAGIDAHVYAYINENPNATRSEVLDYMQTWYGLGKSTVDHALSRLSGNNDAGVQLIARSGGVYNTYDTPERISPDADDDDMGDGTISDY